MGAALKLNPSKISVAEFWKVRGCPLAAALRRRLNKGDKPAKKFLCVYSEELFENRGELQFYSEEDFSKEQKEAPGKPELANHDWSDKKAKINGTLAHTTAIFGFTLAGLIIQDIINDVFE